MKVKTAIKNYKDRLVRKAQKAGIWENFGEEEVSLLHDEYFDEMHKGNNETRSAIMAFEKWCMNLDDKELRELR